MNEPARELGIKDYQSILRRRWRWLIDTPVIVMLIVGGLTLAQTPVYEATAEVAILTEANRALFPATTTTADRLMRNPFAEQEFLSSESFRQAVGADPTDPPSLTYELAPANPDQEIADAGILLFTARADDAAGAAAVANGHAEAYVAARHQQDLAQTNDQLEALEESLLRLRERSNATESQLAALRSELEGVESEAARRRVETDIALVEEERRVLDIAGQIQETTAEIATLEQVANELGDAGIAARVHNPAVEPDAPISPDVRRNLILAALAGLVLGVAGAIARDLLDGTAADPGELAGATGTPVLGAVGVLPKDRTGLERLVHGGGCRTVLNSLSLGGRNPKLRTIAVTSATEGVGKTEIVVGLARVEASTGSRVLIIDGHSTRPAVLARLAPALRRELDVDDALTGRIPSVDDEGGSDVSGIDVIELFSADSDTNDVVRTAELERLLEKLEDRYDLILVDTHAVLGPVDVRPLIAKADAVIVVYEPTTSRIDDLRRTIELLRGTRADVAGLVANRAPSATSGYVYSPVPDAAVH